MAFARPVPSSSLEQQAIDKFSKDWIAGQPIEQTLETFRSRIPREPFEFILEKAKSEKIAGERTPKIIRRGPKDFTLDFNGTMFSVGIKSLENGDFFLNQRRVKISASDSPQEIWNKIEKAMKISNRAGLMDLIFPRAEAVEVILLGAVIVLSMAFAVYAVNDASCLRIEQAISECKTKILDFTTGNYAIRAKDPKKQIVSAKKVVRNLRATRQGVAENMAVGCNEFPKDLKVCIDELVEQGKVTLKVDLRDIPNSPNVSADADPEASETVD